MRISDWSSDVCSSDRAPQDRSGNGADRGAAEGGGGGAAIGSATPATDRLEPDRAGGSARPGLSSFHPGRVGGRTTRPSGRRLSRPPRPRSQGSFFRSEEHTSELQSLMRISYAVFCLKKKKQNTYQPT